MKLLAPDRGCIQVDTRDGTRYHGRRLEVENKRHQREMKEAGYIQADAGGIPRADGFICTECGKRVWFTTCGRCGSAAVRP